jgi:hypothetical protein
METLPTVREDASPVLSHELSIVDLTRQVTTIQQAMSAVMKDGDHFGVIPGTQKPTLLKPGAEKLCLLFRLAPRIRTEKIWHADGHLDVAAYATLVHAPTGVVWAQDVEGFCSSRESKYRYRSAKRACPSCGASAIRKQKAEKGGGWICVGNDMGGCWAKFAPDDPRLSAPGGKIENPDVADVYNTIVKMATKRALVAAVLVTTAASDIFTQDLEDFAVVEAKPEPVVEEEKPTRRRSTPKRDDDPVAEEPAEDEPSEERISTVDRKRLFAAAKEAGLNEAELRETIQEVTGQSSTADLTTGQLEQIITALGSGTQEELS